MTWAAHDETTAPDIGSGLRAKMFPEEELVSALTAIARARGESHWYRIRPLAEVVGFDVRRVFVGEFGFDGWVYQSQPYLTYEACLDALLWPALRLREHVLNGSLVPSWGLLWQALREKAEVMNG